MSGVHTINDIIERRSVRKYKADPVPKDVLELIVKAGAYAPSARDRQARHFTVIRSAALIDRLTEALKAASRDASVPDFLAPMVDTPVYRVGYNAPALILISGDASWRTAEADCALAAGNIMLAAHAMGLGACWINQPSVVCDVPMFRALLDEMGVPHEYRLFSCICLGYPDGVPANASERRAGISNYVG